MKRLPITAAAVLVASLLLASGARAFGTKDVIQMHRDGIADSLIIQKIEHSGKNFDLDSRDIRGLKDAGVSDEIVSAMLATEDRDDYRYGDGYHVYPYPYYYPRAYLGWGWGYYGRYGYYRHYSPYTYRYYSPQPIGSFAPLRHGFRRGIAPTMRGR
jgi:hypothetical protein